MRPSALYRCAFPCLLLSLGAVRLPGQASAPKTVTVTLQPADKYSQESLVILKNDTDYTFATDGTGVCVRTVAVRVQSDAAVKALGVVTVSYAGNSQQVEFEYARVRHPDGSVVESQVSDAIEMPAPVTREAPFYSDLKEKQIPIRSLRAGDTLEWRARITRTKAEAPGNFWGQESFVDTAVALDETVELRVPKGVYVKVWSPKSPAAESDVAAAGAAPAMHVYKWTHSQLKQTAGKEAEAAAEAKKKTIWTAEQEADEDQGKLPDLAWTTFKSWDEVGAWYRGLEADRIVPDADIKAKVAELTAGKTTEEEKARAIYAYVSSHIRYIGVAFGIGRYQPHSASDVLANQYGDCKDKHTLLAAMLSAAGVQSDAVLIGAGIRFNPEVPSPAAFNHLITHVTLAGKLAWLDTTAEIAPFQMLVAPIRDKQALIIPGAGTPRLERTPADPPFATVQTMTAKGELDANGTSHSRLSFELRGDTELVLRSAFASSAPGDYDKVVQQISYGIGYSGTTSNADISNPEDAAAPFRVSYDYKREKSGDWDNLKIVPQVAPVSLPRPGDDDPMVRSIDLGEPRVEISKAEMKLPEGWTAVLPEAEHYKSAYATYDETYRFDHGTLYTERRVEVLKHKVPVTDLKAYKKWADDANLGNEMFVQLVRKNAAAAPATATATPDPATITDAGKLIEQAYADVERMDLYNAQALLDRAAKLSPDHEYYWNTLGYLKLRNGDPTTALADYQKELTLHPAAFRRMYPTILNLQMTMDKRVDAEKSLRDWEKADPENIQPALALLAMLAQDEDYKAAVTEGEQALNRLQEDKNADVLRDQLGSAYLHVNQKEKGAAMLRAVLTHSANPMMLNDAAYALGDASMELPLAESSTRTALAGLADESNAWTLDEQPDLLYGKSRSILATWDTLGWILYREGKLDEAESYLRAAWRGALSFDSGEHLGELLAARGDKAGAVQAWELAIAAEPQYDGMGVRKPPTPKQVQLQARIDELKRTAAPTKRNVSAPAEADQARILQQLRTIPLGRAAGANGTAEYRLLLRNGNAVKVEPTETKTVPGAEKMVSGANFSMMFPKGSPASLVRHGFVNCHSGSCELILAP